MKPLHLIRDCRNRFKYGKNAPHTRQLIWINPQEVTQSLICEKFAISRRNSVLEWDGNSALIMDGDWDLAVQPFKIQPIIHAHFVDGVAWDKLVLTKQETKYKSFYVSMYTELASSKTLRTCRERNPIKNRLLWQRERKGIPIHIGRHGNPIMGHAGNHRFSIVKICNVELIPAMVGFVHLQAIQSGAWQNLLSTSKRKS